MESRQRKDPFDGIGGVAKRQAYEAVRQGKVNIQNATDFMNGLRHFNKPVTSSTSSVQRKTMLELLSRC